MSVEDVRDRLRQAIREVGTLKAFASQHGFTMGFVCDVRSGRRPPSRRIMAALGIDEASPLWPRDLTRAVRDADEVEWTPEMVERLRLLSAAGATRETSAEVLRVKLSALDGAASRYKVKFTRRRKGAAKHPTLSDELVNEIAAAKAEAATAPLYRGGWPV